MKLNFYALFLVMLALAGPIAKAQTTFTVTNTNNSGTGSLRQAMLSVASSGSAGPFTITATAISGTINLSSVLPDIVDNVTFLGPGANNLTVRRSSGGSYRIFVIPNANTVSFNGFTIADGVDTDGGGIYSSGVLTLSNCVFQNNQATGQGGGGVASTNRLTVNSCRFQGNTAGIFGGGISSFDASVSITNTTFINNTAFEGGGLFTLNNATLTNCLFVGNSAASLGGGLEFRGTTTITNCTFSNNSAINFGGGAYSDSNVSSGVFLNTTISFNKSNFGGAISLRAGAVAMFKNCIIAGNTNSDGTAPNDIFNGSTIGASTYNVIGIGGSGGLINGASNNIVGVNALLAPLGDYGGTTQTHALLPGSPAINAGTASDAPTTDQRGISRMGATDIGSFESRGFSMSLSSGNNQSATVNSAFVNPLAVTVSSANSEPVAGGIVTFTGPGSGSGASINPASVTASIGTSTASASVTANATTGGSYTVTASAAGASPNSNFSLTNTIGAPTITGFSTLDNTVCVGSPITFTATVGNVTGSYNFTVTNGTSTTTGATSNTSFSQNLTASGSGGQSFTLIVSDNSQTTTTTTNVTINSLPTAGLTNNGPLSCALTTVTLTASGGSSYTFANGSGTVLAGSGNTRSITTTGTYSVTVANASGCVSTTSTTVTSTTATVTVTNPTTTTATQGTAFSQTFTASGGVTPRSFSVASGSLPTGLSLSTSGVLSGTPTQSGSFPITVQATDANGCSGTSATYTLVVNAPVPTLMGLAVAPATICAGSLVSFTATVGNVTGSYNYTLTNGSNTTTGTTTSAAFSQNLMASGSGLQSFTLTVNSNGQSTTASTSLTVNALPVFTVNPTSVTLTNASPTASLSATGSGNLLWSTGETSSVISVTASGLYSVTLTNASGCSTSATVPVFGADLTVTLELPQANFGSSGTAAVGNFAVNVFEVGGLPTSSGTVTITITVPVGYTLSFPAALTSINVSGGNSTPVNNTLWTVTQNLTDRQITLTMTSGTFIGAGGKSSLGFQITRTTANSGSTSSISVNVATDLTMTYDGNLTNNVYARIIGGL